MGGEILGVGVGGVRGGMCMTSWAPRQVVGTQDSFRRGVLLCWCGYVPISAPSLLSRLPLLSLAFCPLSCSIHPLAARSLLSLLSFSLPSLIYLLLPPRSSLSHTLSGASAPVLSFYLRAGKTRSIQVSSSAGSPASFTLAPRPLLPSRATFSTDLNPKP